MTIVANSKKRHNSPIKTNTHRSRSAMDPDVCRDDSTLTQALNGSGSGMREEVLAAATRNVERRVD
jgi:hypothetical protein